MTGHTGRAKAWSELNAEKEEGIRNPGIPRPEGVLQAVPVQNDPLILHKARFLRIWSGRKHGCVWSFVQATPPKPYQQSPRMPTKTDVSSPYRQSPGLPLR